MPCRKLVWHWLLAAAWAPAAASATDVTAGAPTARSITVYRQSGPGSESLDLDALSGFALVTETRQVEIPAGESRIRFEGVANGIEPQTALISGFPSGIREKNEDARVLSPAELVASAVGHDVTLVRTHPRTGQATQITGVIRSDSEGVVFESAEGVEALRCSGLPETFRFEPRTDLSASPTLSVQVDNPAPISLTVTLSYLSEGFDWTADYVATLASDRRTLDLGAWVTLANGNDVSFPGAHTQVVAGSVNRVETEGDLQEPARQSSAILASCWPIGTTTSDLPTGVAPPPEAPVMLFRKSLAAAPAAALQEVAVTARVVEQEQLGDLKLYRVPEPTDVQSKQMKQIRLLDRETIPVETYYRADLATNAEIPDSPASEWIRTRNDTQHHLGLPLPAGNLNLFTPAGDSSLLIGQSLMRDSAVNETLDLRFGESDDVQVRSTIESEQVTSGKSSRVPPYLRRIRRFRSATVDQIQRIEISNARDSSVPVELHLRLVNTEQLIRCDETPTISAGAAVFKLNVPANGTTIIRYQTEHLERSVVR